MLIYSHRLALALMSGLPLAAAISMDLLNVPLIVNVVIDERRLKQDLTLWKS